MRVMLMMMSMTIIRVYGRRDSVNHPKVKRMRGSIDQYSWLIEDLSSVW